MDFMVVRRMYQPGSGIPVPLNFDEFRSFRREVLNLCNIPKLEGLKDYQKISYMVGCMQLAAASSLRRPTIDPSEMPDEVDSDEFEPPYV